MVEDVGSPVPGGVGGLEGAEEGLVVNAELGGVRGVGVCEVDDHGAGSNAGEIKVEEEFEVESGGLCVECFKEARELVKIGIPATIVEGEGIDTSVLSERDVSGVVPVFGLFNEQVVGKDKRPGRGSLG